MNGNWLAYTMCLHVDEMSIVCQVSTATSVTFGSWFQRDKFLCGSTNKAANILLMCQIRYENNDRGAVKMADARDSEILRRGVIQNATLFKTFQNKMLLCFKSGRNLGKNESYILIGIC